MITVLRKDQFETKRNEIHFDLLTTNTTYNLREGGFDIAFTTEAFWNLSLEEEKRYIQWEVKEVKYTRNYTTNTLESDETLIDVVHCNSSYFDVSPKK